METIEVGTIVVGGGVIGLAVAAEIARRGWEPFVLEAAGTFGTGTSSRNSEVVHSGIYYPADSLKCRFCVDGRRRLYAYSESRGIAYRKCGKLIVATSDAEIAKIEGLARQAGLNGVSEAQLIDGRRARELEPALSAVAALHLPETGILDSHAFMQALVHDVERDGGAMMVRHKVLGGSCRPGAFKLKVETPYGALALHATRLVLAAGLWSHGIAGRLDGYVSDDVPVLSLAKGSYFSYSGKPAFSRLIYPAPVDGGLGTHLTLDLMGRMRFGPDVEWLDHNDPDALDFSVDSKRAMSFYGAIRRYWPDLPDGTLMPDYSGVRPKLSRAGESAADFRLHGPKQHGIEGLVALYGIESPGLTASLAVADAVAKLLM